MNNPKHTPAPWRVSQGGGYIQQCQPGTLIDICEMWTKDQAEREANARLIAAAPDMLEALEATSAMFNRLCDNGKGICPNNALHNRIDAAIAKAKGVDRG